MNKSLNCLVCSSKNIIDYKVYLNEWIKEKHTYSKCIECEFIFVNPRPKPEVVKEIYTKHTNPFVNDEYEGMSVEFESLSHLSKKLKSIKIGKLLDVGCGRGDFLKIATKYGFSVYGTDLGTSNQYDDIKIFNGLLQEANLPNESFDIVVTRNTIEHLFDANLDLKEIKRVLKKDGYLYVKVPNVNYEQGWKCKLFFGFKSLFTPPVHLNHFSQTSLRRLLENNGFEFVSWEMEKPSKSKNFYKKLILKLGFKTIDIVRILTFGRYFPKPVLCILVKNKN